MSRGGAALAFVSLLAPHPVSSQEEPTPAPIVRAAATDTPPTIDGIVEPSEWQSASQATGFVQQQPLEDAPSTEKTVVRLLFDEDHLYVSVVCFDREPDRIVVTQSRRDGDLENSDSIQLILDTFDDDQNAFLFGTNPLGVEYDGQVASEGSTGGALSGVGSGFGGGGSQRGQLAGFNRNWDGDWTVAARVSERGWETELAIPFKTLRYRNETDPVWGFNVMRTIRRKNEQAFLAPIPRAFNIYRVSLASDLVGLSPPRRRELHAIPFASGEVNEERLAGASGRDQSLNAGIDIKWGMTPNLAADFTVNTDFSQVEADEEQVNLTRFDLFFPEKRSFFLENASTFQFGEPQNIDLFFSRRIGLSETGEPIGILGGARMTGKIGSTQLGLLNMQTEKSFDARTGDLLAPANNYTVVRLKRDIYRRSDIGGIFVNRVATGSAASEHDINRAYGLDANLTTSENGKLFAFIARSDSPSTVGSDTSGRALYDYRTNAWNMRASFTQVGDRFRADVGFIPRVGYRRPEVQAEWTPQIERVSWIRRISPHFLVQRYYGFDGKLQSALGHYDFEVNLENGGQFGFLLERRSDRPLEPFTIFNRRGADEEDIVIPPGLYSWNEWMGYFQSDPSAALFVDIIAATGSFYDGNFRRLSLNSGFRIGARVLATLGYLGNDIELPRGSFVSHVVRLKANYSFSTRTNLQALVQFNNQADIASSNIRLAWLNRSGTGLFIVFNERRDVFIPGSEPIGRSFIIKYTHFLSF